MITDILIVKLRNIIYCIKIIFSYSKKAKHLCTIDIYSVQMKQTNKKRPHSSAMTSEQNNSRNQHPEVDLRRMRPDAVPCLIPEGCPKFVSGLEEVSPDKIHVLRSFLYNLQCHNCQSFSWVEVLIYSSSSERIFIFIY